MPSVVILLAVILLVVILLVLVPVLMLKPQLIGSKKGKAQSDESCRSHGHERGEAQVRGTRHCWQLVEAVSRLVLRQCVDYDKPGMSAGSETALLEPWNASLFSIPHRTPRSGDVFVREDAPA